jgi:hypothetical protein
MKSLDFGRYSSTEWREFKRIHQMEFWEEAGDIWRNLRYLGPERWTYDLRTARFNYFQGQANLELALFSYICHKNRGLLPESLYPKPDRSQEGQNQIPTPSVA